MNMKFANLFWLAAIVSLSACGGGGAGNNTSADYGAENFASSEGETIYCPAVEQRVSRDDCDDLTREDAEVRRGAAAFNVPDPMRRGQTVEVHLVIDRRSPQLIRILEARAANNSMMETNMTDGPASNVIGSESATSNTSAGGDDGQANATAPVEEDAAPTPGQIVNQLEGTPDRFDPLVGRHMRAELVGQGFDIVARSEASQDIPLGGQATWMWEVTAREGGARSLTLLTVVEGIANGRRFVLARTPKVRTVTVSVSLRDRIWDALVAAPSWIKAVTAVIAALGGLATAWFGLPWLKRRAAAKESHDDGRPADAEEPGADETE